MARAYYFQTRKGRRVRVRKGKNRINLYKGTKVSRAVVRGSIPVKDGEIYGKGAIVIGDRSKSIKAKEGVSISRKGEGIKIAGRFKGIKGAIAIDKKRGREVEAIAYNNNSNLVEFNQGYYFQTRHGKRVKVRKRKKLDPQIKDDLITAAKYGGSATGFVAGAGLGNLAVKLAKTNGMLRNMSMAGGAIAAVLANHLFDKYEEK